jgi:hypothetical protein
MPKNFSQYTSKDVIAGDSRRGNAKKLQQGLMEKYIFSE